MLNNYFNLGFFPTPIHKLQHLSGQFPGYNLYIKRDDQTGLALGGNKTRKLEYLVKDALDKDCDSLVTIGAAQSNHCRQTAAAANLAGVKSHLLLRGVEPDVIDGNLLLDKLLGATIHWTSQNGWEIGINDLIAELRRKGENPYLIPVGGSNEVGCLGYVRSIQELRYQLAEQNERIDFIVFASCSGGTHAGMVLGKHIYSLDSEIVGINIDKKEMGDVTLQQHIINVCNKTAPYLNVERHFGEADVHLIKGYDSAGYGIVTPQEINAISLLARTEGIFLDPVYTARAVAGLLDCLKKKLFPEGSNVLFWHTGGAPSLFHYANDLAGS